MIIYSVTPIPPTMHFKAFFLCVSLNKGFCGKGSNDIASEVLLDLLKTEIINSKNPERRIGIEIHLQRKTVLLVDYERRKYALHFHFSLVLHFKKNQ